MPTTAPSALDVFLVSLVQFATVAVMAGITVLLTAPVVHFGVSSMAVFAVVYCAIFPTIICFTLQNIYQRFVTPTRAGLIYTLDPVWSLLAGFFILGERLNPLEWFGCGMIFLAALIPMVVRYISESRLLSRYTGSSGL